MGTTVSYSAKDISARGDWLIKWEHLGEENGLTGDPFSKLKPSSLMTVSFDGIFDGAKVKLQGSIDETLFTLNDPQGNSLTSSSPKLEAVLEKVRGISPVVEHPGPKTDITVTVLVCA